MAFAARLRGGATEASLLANGHTIREVIRWDDLAWSRLEAAVFILIAAVGFGLVFGALRRWTVVPWLVASICAITFAGVVAILGIGGVVEGRLVPREALWSGAAPLGVLAAVLVSSRAGALGRASVRTWILIAAIAAMPWVYAFGTSNNYWITASHAGFLWTIAALMALRMGGNRSPLRLSALLTLVAGVQLVAALVVSGAADMPYRQTTSLRSMHTEVTIGRDHARLDVGEDSGAYLMTLQSGARDHGFQPGTPLLDLTGRSPGVVFALGGRAIGQAWMIGGYAGSVPLARTTLSRVPCEVIARAWILDEPGGRRHIPTRVMMPSGADVETDYDTVTRARKPYTGSANTSGYQTLMAPNRSEKSATSACEFERNKREHA
jgi:hypothetical protein